MNPPFFTIITVVKNNVNTIERTIKSVINQSFDNYEYLIIDGNSNDGTEAIIQKYSTHNKISVISENDLGIYFAMNKGVIKSTGKFINLLNSDDYFKSTEVLDNYYTYSINNNLDSNVVLFSNMNILKENIIILNLKPSIKYLKKNMRMNHPTWFVSNDVYNRIGHYNTQYKIAADYDFAMRCVKYNVKLVQIPSLTSINFALGGASQSSIKIIRESYIVRSNYSLTTKFENIFFLFLELLDLFKWKVKEYIK